MIEYNKYFFLLSILDFRYLIQDFAIGCKFLMKYELENFKIKFLDNTQKSYK